MKCYKHHDRDAIATCSHCGKGICNECFNEYGRNLCEEGVLIQVKLNKQKMIKNSIIMAILFVVGFAQDGNLLFAIGLAGVPWGWSMLTRITPAMFVSMSFFGWIMYFAMKLAIACCIGVFVTPYQIYKVVNEIQCGNKIEQYVKSKY